jgi:hypothetical protein
MQQGIKSSTYSFQSVVVVNNDGFLAAKIMRDYSVNKVSIVVEASFSLIRTNSNVR